MARSAPAAGVVERTVRAQPKIATAVGTAPRQIRMRRIRWRKARRIASQDKPRAGAGPSRQRCPGAPGPFGPVDRREPCDGRQQRQVQPSATAAASVPRAAGGPPGPAAPNSPSGRRAAARTSAVTRRTRSPDASSKVRRRGSSRMPARGSARPTAPLRRRRTSGGARPLPRPGGQTHRHARLGGKAVGQGDDSAAEPIAERPRGHRQAGLATELAQA